MQEKIHDAYKGIVDAERALEEARRKFADVLVELQEEHLKQAPQVHES